MTNVTVRPLSPAIPSIPVNGQQYGDLTWHPRKEPPLSACNEKDDDDVTSRQWQKFGLKLILMTGDEDERHNPLLCEME